jgi:hypothetical protein
VGLMSMLLGRSGRIKSLNETSVLVILGAFVHTRTKCISDERIN